MNQKTQQITNQQNLFRNRFLYLGLFLLATHYAVFLLLHKLNKEFANDLANELMFLGATFIFHGLGKINVLFKISSWCFAVLVLTYFPDLLKLQIGIDQEIAVYSTTGTLVIIMIWYFVRWLFPRRG